MEGRHLCLDLDTAELHWVVVEVVCLATKTILQGCLSRMQVAKVWTRLPTVLQLPSILDLQAVQASETDGVPLAVVEARDKLVSMRLQLQGPSMQTLQTRLLCNAEARVATAPPMTLPPAQVHTMEVGVEAVFTRTKIVAWPRIP
jgi:hypothetical protein